MSRMSETRLGKIAWIPSSSDPTRDVTHHCQQGDSSSIRTEPFRKRSGREDGDHAIFDEVGSLLDQSHSGEQHHLDGGDPDRDDGLSPAGSAPHNIRRQRQDHEHKTRPKRDCDQVLARSAQATRRVSPSVE